jgi:hypothetical protein
MPTINKLPLLDTISGGDQLPVYAPNSGDARRMSITALTDYMQDTLDLPDNSDEVSFLQSGTGAVTRTVQSKLRDVVSVKDFGAKGDGVTNDTAAIQAAITAVFSSGGGTVFFPKGVYMVSSLAVNWSGQVVTMVLAGEGQAASEIKKISGTASAVLTLSSSSLGDGTYSEIRDLTVNANGLVNTCIDTVLVARNVFRSVTAKGALGVGVSATGALINSFYDCNLINNGYGYQCRKSGVVRCNLVQFFGGSIKGNSSWGMDIGDTSALNLYGVDIELNGTIGNIGGGIIIRSTCGDEFAGANISINGVWFEANRGTTLWSEPAPNLILAVRDTPIIDPEGGRSMRIDAISQLTLDAVWANKTGDESIIAAASCSIRDSAIRVLTDTSAKRIYENSLIAGAHVQFQSSSVYGRRLMNGPAVNCGTGNAESVSGSAVTLFTANGLTPRMINVFACLGGAGSAYTSNARFAWDAANLVRMGGENAANLTLTASGANIQATQTSGVNQTIFFVVDIIG